MKDLINDIYNNAINKVFGEKILHEDGFDNLCYHQMIDETHSPYECEEIYNRLINDKNFPTIVQYNWEEFK